MIIVIADDITGAAEMAGIAHRFGYQTEVRIGSIQPSNADVQVIDTDTRSKTEAEAVKIIVQLMKELESLEYQLLYKKTDSALRGHIAVEVDTIIENSNYSKVIFAPANPSLGRTIQQGIYFINGKPLHETDFANDPEFPAHRSKVSEVIQFKNPAVIPDLISVESFPQIVSRINIDTLAVGGSDFFEVLLATFRKNLRPLEEKGIRWPEKTLMISGSRSAYSSHFLMDYKAKGLVYQAITLELLQEKSVQKELAWIETVNSNILENRILLLKLEDDASPILSPKEIANRISLLVAEIVSGLPFPVQVLLEGGSTASSIFKALKINSFEVAGEHLRGIVSLKTNEYKNIIFTIKPGSYKWPDSLINTWINS